MFKIFKPKAKNQKLKVGDYVAVRQGKEEYDKYRCTVHVVQSIEGWEVTYGDGGSLVWKADIRDCVKIPPEQFDIIQQYQNISKEYIPVYDPCPDIKVGDTIKTRLWRYDKEYLVLAVSETDVVCIRPKKNGSVSIFPRIDCFVVESKEGIKNDKKVS